MIEANCVACVLAGEEPYTNSWRFSGVHSFSKLSQGKIFLLRLLIQFININLILYFKTFIENT